MQYYGDHVIELYQMYSGYRVRAKGVRFILPKKAVVPSEVQGESYIPSQTQLSLLWRSPQYRHFVYAEYFLKTSENYLMVSD